MTAADVIASRSELTTYYARYLEKTQSQAATMAADAVSALMNTAQECE